MTTLDFRTNRFGRIIEGEFAVAVFANVFEQHLQPSPAMRAVKVHTHRIQRQ